MKTVSLWSGGKDSCFAYYKAKQDHEVAYLLNFTDTNSKHSLSHGLKPELIQEQARMLGVPLIQKAMPKQNYRQEFKDLILGLKEKEDIRGIVFGDIYLQEHKDWIDKVCQELEVKAIFPIWTVDTKKLIAEIIDSGFKAIIVTARADCAGGKEWLGKEVDKEFIAGLAEDIDPCGEKGEFHTFVYDGPIFNRPVRFKSGRKVLQDKRWFLEITL